MIELPTTPDDTVKLFSRLLGEGRVDDIMSLYDHEATFVPEPGRAVSGHDDIRREIEQFVALTPRMEGTVQQVLESGDTALVSYSWEMSGTAPDGTSVELGGVSSDVLRRRVDGSWAVTIDDPFGGALPIENTSTAVA